MTRRGQAGFTLIEVMIALFIFAMIAAAGVAILSFSVRAGAATAVRLDGAAAVDRTVAVLSADLAQAVNRPARDEAGTVRPAFVGEATGLALVRGGWSNLDAAPRPSLQKVGYALVDGRLERTAYPRVDGAASLPPAALMTDLRQVRFRFRRAGAWADRWDGTGGAALPDAAELLLVRRDGVTFRAMMVVGTGYVEQQGVGRAN